jgi:hypothetical protein
MITATLAGAYACKRQGTVCSYDAAWEATERAVFWIAKINCNRRFATPSGTTTFQLRVDRADLFDRRLRATLIRAFALWDARRLYSELVARNATSQGCLSVWPIRAVWAEEASDHSIYRA